MLEDTGTEHSGRALLLFARFPRPGAVKTRLAETIGHEAAKEFYRLCAEHVFDQSAILSCSVDRFVFYSDANERDEMETWVGPHFRLEAQTGADLGERMGNAFRSVFSRGVRKAVLVGTDVPDLSASIIDDAIRSLDSYDVVIGPCHDGGYYLVGMKELHHEIFVDIPWSTDAVLERTQERINSLGLTLNLLPTLADIDTAEDLRSWIEANVTQKGNPVRASARCLLASSGTVGRFTDEGESP
jgi:rSAM/selenodomain-associated transferase 1